MSAGEQPAAETFEPPPPAIPRSRVYILLDTGSHWVHNVYLHNTRTYAISQFRRMGKALRAHPACSMGTAYQPLPILQSYFEPLLRKS
jgi:hypothetical protein